MGNARLALLAAAVLIGACRGAPTASPTPTASPSPSAPATASPTAEPSPTATPAPPATATPTPAPSPSPSVTPTAAAGPPGPDCINGWVNPPAGDPERQEGPQILSDYMGLTDPLVVEDMRFFVGPDPPWIIEPRFEEVEHWYIKATLSSDPTYRGRWLVEKRDEQRLGVSAVAPYGTTGYQSPDWHGFVGDGLPRPIPGLPGLWGGIDYDFVTGEGDSGFPGLADEVAGCLAGT